MFMGPIAFSYYLPVIDRYLREITHEEEGCDTEANILGHVVQSQLDSNEAPFSASVVQEIEALSKFVLSSPTRYSDGEGAQAEIVSTWGKVHSALENYRSQKRR